MGRLHVTFFPKNKKRTFDFENCEYVEDDDRIILVDAEMEECYDALRVVDMNVSGVASMCRSLRGAFAFCLYNRKDRTYIIGRDSVSFMDLYYCTRKRGDKIMIDCSDSIASLLKIAPIMEFPPGYILFGTSTSTMLMRYQNIRIRPFCFSKNLGSLEQAIRRRVFGGDDILRSPVINKCVAYYDGTSFSYTMIVLLRRYTNVTVVSAVQRGQTVDVDPPNIIVHYDLRMALDVLKDVIISSERYDVETIKRLIPLYILSKNVQFEELWYIGDAPRILPSTRIINPYLDIPLCESENIQGDSPRGLLRGYNPRRSCSIIDVDMENEIGDLRLHVKKIFDDTFSVR